jgi:DNA phosphorothioation-associated putative methyltransferase
MSRRFNAPVLARRPASLATGLPAHGWSRCCRIGFVTAGAHRTAMHRQTLSLPAQRALLDGLLTDGDVLDYGCGRGGDVDRLSRAGLEVRGWDPHYAPIPAPSPADAVLCSYVLNVIADPSERIAALRDAWRLTRRVLVVAVRTDREASRVPGTPAADGLLTSRGTFQLLLPAESFANWVGEAVEQRPTPVGTGLVYVFRSDAARAAYLVSRFGRTPDATALMAAGSGDVRAGAPIETLSALTAWVGRGRPPAPEEDARLCRAGAAHFGTIARAFAAAEQLLPHGTLELGRRRAKDDLLVFLALDAFHGRTAASQLPMGTVADARAFYGSHRRAVTESDRLLRFLSRRDLMAKAVRVSRVGKPTATALYVHADAVALLSAPLRAYTACAELVSGRPASSNLVKLNHDRPAVSFLNYPTFDHDAHPQLAESLHVDLAARTATWTDYAGRTNRPLLHRKEEFVGPGHPRRALWERLTAREVAAGLYTDPSRIGTAEGWQRALDEAGVTIRGHRLYRAQANPSVPG